MGSNSQKAAFIKDPNHPSFASKSNLYFLIYKIPKKKNIYFGKQIWKV